MAKGFPAENHDHRLFYALFAFLFFFLTSICLMKTFNIKHDSKYVRKEFVLLESCAK